MRIAFALCLALSLTRDGSLSAATAPVSLSGTVLDVRGATVSAASVTLLTPMQGILATTTTDHGGRFSFADLAPGSYLLLVKSAGFAERRVPVQTRQATAMDLVVRLDLQAPGQVVTVTASLGAAEAVSSAPQAVNVIERDQIRARATAVLAQAVSEEPGVHLQRTSPTIAGIFVRGLTGNKVNVFIDGVRYSTSAMRGGINTFLDLVEPSGLEAIEILRGPNSAQYGSDAIGGSVQLVSRIPSFSADGSSTVRGSFETQFSSVDSGFGSNIAGTWAGRNAGILVNLAARRSNTLRPGGGIDSHAAVTRFLGLRSRVLGGTRLPDTAFTQYGGTFKLNWAPDPRSQLVAYFARGQQDGGKRYDQLLGGDGNLVAALRNLMLDLAYLRYDRYRGLRLDQFSLVYSLNTQREERVNQGGGGNPRAPVNHEYERTTVHGLQLFGRKQSGRHTLLGGAEYYRERISAPSFGVSPVTGVSSPRRGRVPDGARYNSGGIYLEDGIQVLPNRLRLVGNLRYSVASYRARAADSPIVSGGPLWPDDALRVSNATFRLSALITLHPTFNLFAALSRGFRAPHATDLGTFGLTGSGFEISAPEIQGLGATVGSTADSSARSTGRPVEQVRPETSLNFEVGGRFQNRRWFAQAAVFVNEIHDSITKQSLILPAGAVGRVLAGQPVTAQTADGSVFVAAASNPVLVRTNFGDARIAGIEQSLDFRPHPNLSIGTVFTYARAEDTATGLPPNIEGGTPAPDGWLKLRYTTPGSRFWIEPYLHAAARQGRLSTLDIEDRRTGAARSRSSIRSFFLNGATARGLVSPGPDGVAGTADDRLSATGETLLQVQDRVLGAGVASAPLFTAIPGYVTLNMRAGIRLGEKQDLLVQLDNLADRNYRGISWGLDAPGRSVSLSYRTRF